MTKPAKLILGFSLLCLVFSFTSVGAQVYYGILRPVGAVAFIVFYLVNMLGKEMTKFDQDHPGEVAPKDSSASRANATLITSH